MRLWQATPRIRPTREDWRRTPPSALAVSVLALIAAGLISLVWPDSVNEYAGFVWILALIPVFLLSYYRGWSGAAAAAAGAMVALTLFEVVIHRWLAFEADWLVVGAATAVLIPVTVGAGWLSDRLIGARSEERKLHERAPVPMMVHTGAELRYANRAAIDLLGLADAQEAGGRSLMEFVHADDQERFRERLARLQEAGEFQEAGRERFRLVRSDGRQRTVEIDSLPVLYGREHAVQSIVRDISERARMEAQLERLALYDGLTGLPNRHLFEDRLQMALSRAQRQSSRVGVLFLDLDGFKAVNDRMGHAVGDRVLERVAQRLEENVREEDTVARFGGDEFTVLLEDQESDPPAREAGARLSRAVGGMFNVSGHEFHVDASVGVTTWEPGSGAPAPDPGTLVRRADMAMLKAKEGGGGVHVFDPGSDAARTRQLERENRLREALESDEFRLHYQPIVRLRNGSVVAVEPLARWERPDGEMIPPARFIPLAEETGLIVRLGEELLRQACRQLAAWEADFPAGDRLLMHPNLSGRQLDEPGVLETIRDVVLEAGLPMDRIGFELTEGEILRSRDRVAELKDLGARIVIDDFGTGHSSINYIRELPVDGLKLDMSYVHRLGRDATSDRIVELIVGLGDALDLDVYAEGVEREVQAEKLRSAGCEYGQGRYFGAEVPAEEFQSVLASR